MALAREKGFGTKSEEINVGEKVALIHTQVSAAYEGYRKKRMKGKNSFENEISGAMIRIIHLCAVLGIDIEKAVEKKIKEGRKRTWDWSKLNEKHA